MLVEIVLLLANDKGSGAGEGMLEGRREKER